MNAGRWQAWSSATRPQPALRPPELRPREHRQPQIDHRRVQRVQRVLEPEPVPRRHRPAGPQQRAEKVPTQFPRLLRVHPRQRRPRHLTDAQVVPPMRQRRQVRHDVPKAARPRQLRHPIATNWLHRGSLRGLRPVPCFPRQPLELMARNQLEQTPEHRAIVCHGLDPLCSDWLLSNTIIPHGDPSLLSNLMGHDPP